MSYSQHIIEQIVGEAVAGKITAAAAAERILNEDLLMELMVLKPFETGLPFEVFVTERAYTTQHHRPRLKVSDRQGQISATVAIDDPIEVMGGTRITGKAWKLLVRYIQINRGLLMQLWNEEISQRQFGNSQQRV